LINNKDELTSKEKPTEEGKEQKKVKTKRLISDLFYLHIHTDTGEYSYQMMLHKTLQNYFKCHKTDTSSSNR
jgi:hypothetical protein